MNDNVISVPNEKYDDLPNTRVMFFSKIGNSSKMTDVPIIDLHSTTGARTDFRSWTAFQVALVINRSSGYT